MRFLFVVLVAVDGGFFLPFLDNLVYFEQWVFAAFEEDVSPIKKKATDNKSLQMYIH